MGAVFRKWSQMSLVLRILIGLLIGAVLGLTVPHWTAIDILGIVFVSALKAIAPILVAVLVTASIAKAGDGLGPRFRTVISRYMLSTFIAALCAVVGSFLFPVTLQLRDVVDQVAPGAITDIFTNLLANMVINPMMSVSTVGVEVSFMSALFLSIITTFAACGASGVAGGSLLLVPPWPARFSISATMWRCRPLLWALSSVWYRTVWRLPSTPVVTYSLPPQPNITTGRRKNQ